MYLQKVCVGGGRVCSHEIPIKENFKLRSKRGKEESEGHCMFCFLERKEKQTRISAG